MPEQCAAAHGNETGLPGGSVPMASPNQPVFRRWPRWTPTAVDEGGIAPGEGIRSKMGGTAARGSREHASMILPKHPRKTGS